MSKNKKSILCLLLLFLLNNLIGQDVFKNPLPMSSDSDFYSLSYPDVEERAAKIKPLTVNAFDLKLVEVDSTNAPFTYNGGGGAVGYCGNVREGIINLLQKQTGVTTHIRFLNAPLKQRYVLFYGQSFYSHDSEVGDTSSKIACFGPVSFNLRDMVMKIMSQLFNFEVKQSDALIDVLKLRVVDSYKLQAHKKTLAECINGGSSYYDEQTKDYFVKCAPIDFLLIGIEESLNIVTYDETKHSASDYFNITIPHKYLESLDKIDELNKYLESKYGLTLKKEKALEKIYTIKFNNE